MITYRYCRSYRFHLEIAYSLLAPDSCDVTDSRIIVVRSGRPLQCDLPLSVGGHESEAYKIPIT